MNHNYFMDMALQHAQAALEQGEFPVGCVITGGKAVIASGEREGSAGNTGNETDHAEIRALRQLNWIFQASSRPIDPGTLTLYCTLEPCLMCFGAIVIHGIRHIVYGCDDPMGGGTRCDRTTLPPLYRDADLTITTGIREKESRSLFRTYFKNPDNKYLKDTLLATHMLK